MDNTLFDTADRLFAGLCTPAAIRAIESGGEVTPLWDALEESGFGHALLPEAASGSGLALADVWPVMFSAGRHAVPVPLAQTMLARAWLHAAGRSIEHGSVTFAPFRVRREGDHLIARGVSFGAVASWVLAADGVLVFKWNETQVKLGEVLACCPHQPLFGNTSGRKAGTHWLVFMKPRVG